MARDKETRRIAQRGGLLTGAILFFMLLLLSPPPALSLAGWKTAAVAVLMAVWWMTEAIPIPVTALLPLVLFPILGVLEMPVAAAPYANELIFLFMGGFLLALAMERWGLHKRIALEIIRLVGVAPQKVILGFMLATAFLSMWVSNTAVATMMLPIALAVGEKFRPGQNTQNNPPDQYNFGIGLMLAIAYSASIGGAATLIGTPPNAILAGAAQELLGIQIGFVEWMSVGLPISLVFLPFAWLLLTRVLYPPGPLPGDAAEVLQTEQANLGRVGRGEKIVGAVFTLTAVAWLLRSPKLLGSLTLPGLQTWAPAVQDSTIAVTAAVLLFLLPVDWRRGVFALDWQTAQKIPWDVLILFGGGLSLARAMAESGLAVWIGTSLEAVGNVPPIVLFGLVATLFVFLTEITSNTATSTMAMPVMAGIASGLGVSALALMATAALSASMAFMLPVATPPNAIVFGSTYLTIPHMTRAGVWMNLVAIVIITLAVTCLVPVLLIK